MSRSVVEALAFVGVTNVVVMWIAFALGFAFRDAIVTTTFWNLALVLVLEVDMRRKAAR